MITCANCGIGFDVPNAWEQKRRDDHRGFYCPNGHPLAFYAASDAELLRRERDRLKQQLAQKDDEIADGKKQIAAARGQITKIKKRASAGVCQCCHRTFTNVALHMKTKHPGLSKPRLAEAV